MNDYFCGNYTLVVAREKRADLPVALGEKTSLISELK